MNSKTTYEPVRVEAFFLELSEAEEAAAQGMTVEEFRRGRERAAFLLKQENSILEYTAHELEDFPYKTMLVQVPYPVRVTPSMAEYQQELCGW
jgi:hypothetical protein